MFSAWPQIPNRAPKGAQLGFNIRSVHLKRDHIYSERPSFDFHVLFDGEQDNEDMHAHAVTQSDNQELDFTMLQKQQLTCASALVRVLQISDTLILGPFHNYCHQDLVKL